MSMDLKNLETASPVDQTARIMHNKNSDAPESTMLNLFLENIQWSIEMMDADSKNTLQCVFEKIKNTNLLDKEDKNLEDLINLVNQYLNSPISQNQDIRKGIKNQLKILYSLH